MCIEGVVHRSAWILFRGENNVLSSKFRVAVVRIVIRSGQKLFQLDIHSLFCKYLNQRKVSWCPSTRWLVAEHIAIHGHGIVEIAELMQNN